MTKTQCGKLLCYHIYAGINTRIGSGTFMITFLGKPATGQTVIKRTIALLWADLTLTALGWGGGGGGPQRPPLDKFSCRRKTAAFSTAPLHDFFLWSLADILTPSLRKSDLPLRSHVTFCDQRSTQKVRIFLILCTKQMAQWKFILACKSVILSCFCFVYH